MGRKTLRVSLLLGAFASSTILAADGNQDFLQVVAGVHFDSRVSGGRYTIEELAGIARQKRLHVAIITDRDNATVEYGLWPLRKILRVRFSAGSIRDLGGRKYLDAYRAAQQRNANVLLIPGAEAMPYYHWEVNLGNALRAQWRDIFKVRNLHEHILVLGLPRGEDYDGLPSLAKGYPRRFAPSCLLNLLWLGLVILALRLGL
ncbi:MAG: hypothetical protein FJ272_10010, partial [Planctomycetes bacterium]|nr:hypothetical protein [Planctomycetota bacterium]